MSPPPHSPEIAAMLVAVADLKAHIESLHEKQMRYLVRMNNYMEETLEEYHKRISALEPPDGPANGSGFKVMEGG